MHHILCIPFLFAPSRPPKVGSTLLGLFSGVSLHPEALRKAHAELDAVVGPHRLPDFGDRDSLPYVNAIIKESMRWHSALPFGVPHATVADDEFRGYFIPAETMLIPNTWYVAPRTLTLDSGQRAEHLAVRACMHDPEVYEDPHVFRPERFIRDGKLDLSGRDPAPFIFGYGRRHVAIDRLYLQSYVCSCSTSPESAPDVTSPKTRCSSVSPAYCMSSTLRPLSEKMAAP